MAKSLQDRLREKRSSTFVGREQYLELFKQNLSRSLESDDYSFIFSIHGQGGVGKTTLINKFQELAKEFQALVVYTNEGIREIPELLGAFAKQFKEQGAPHKKLEEHYRTYLQEKKRLEADPEAPKSTWSFGGKMLAKGGKELAKYVIPGSGLVLDHLNTDAIGEQIGEWASFLKKKIGNKDEIELLLNPIEVLTPLFLEGLSELANRSKICFFFDTYENTDIYLDEWLRQLLEGKFGHAPENILIIIAGRDPLNPNHWVDFAGSISTISLEPFSDNEARNYLARKKVTDSATIETIIQLSGCLPVLLEILAEKAPNSPDDVNDRCETAVERFLKWIEDQTLRDLALHAALPNLLNEDIVKRLLPDETDVTKHFNWLRSNPFVYKRDDHWAYHSYVRELMLRYQRQLSLESWEELNIKLAEYYLERANILGLEKDTQWKDSTWIGWMLEYHYHQLLAAPKKAIAEVMQAFARVFRLNGFSHAIPWSEIIVQAEQITQETAFGLILRKGLAAWQSNQYTIAVQMFSLINKHGWLVDTEDLSNIYFGEAYCWHNLDQFAKAIIKYQKAIELKPNDAKIHYYLGKALYSFNDLPGSIIQFQKAIELKPDYSDVYIDLGSTLRFFNDLPGSILNFQKAIELKPTNANAYIGLGMVLWESNDLFEAKIQIQKAIELRPGLSLGRVSLGLIFLKNNDLSEAIEQFKAAIELQPEYFLGYFGLGLALIESNNPPEAIEQLQKAIELKPDYAFGYFYLGLALQDYKNLPEAIEQFQKVIELKPDYADAYYKLGKLYQAIGNQSSAIKQYQKVIELHPDFADVYIGLGLAYHSVDDLPGAFTQYQKAIELKSDNPLLYLCLGIAFQDSNDFLKAIEQYQKAIEFQPDLVTAYQNLGWIYLLTHQLKEAKVFLDKSWELNIENETANAKHLGHLELLKDNKEKAIYWYKTSIQLNEKKEDFFEGMDTDFINLQMEKHGVSREIYDSLLQKLRAFI